MNLMSSLSGARPDFVALLLLRGSSAASGRGKDGPASGHREVE
jgi:hypothetical protein